MESQVEKKTLDNAVILDSKPEKPVSFNTNLNAEEVFEQLGGHVGGWTKWHIFVFNVLCIFGVTYVGLHSPAIVFLGLEPSTIHCALPDGTALNTSVPCDDGEGATCVYSQCEVYTHYSDTSNTTETCPDGWTYSDEIESIATEWDLVCDKSYLIETTNFLGILGGMTLGGALSILADHYGRKWIFLVCLIGAIAAGVLNGLCRTLLAYIITRVILTTFQTVAINASYILMSELFIQTSRQTAIMLSEIHWVAGMLLLAMLAYVLPNWRHLMFVTSLPFLGVVFFVRAIPESPSWLISRGRTKEAREMLIKVAKFNKQDIPTILLSDEKSNIEGVTTISGSVEKTVEYDIKNDPKKRKKDKPPKNPESDIRLIFKSKILCYFLVVSIYICFTMNLVYFGLVFNTAALPGDVYVNFILGALAELPATVVGIIGLKYFGRRSVTAVHFIICAVALLALLGISESGMKDDLEELEILCYLVGKYANTVSFLVVLLYLTELFPTPLRSTSVTMCLIGGSFGKLLSPYTSLIVDIVPWLPQTLFGGMSFIAGILIFLLPETVGMPLPQTVKDVEDWTRNQKRKKSQLEEEKGKELKGFDNVAVNVQNCSTNM